MIKLTNLLKEIRISVPGTRVYVSDPFVELYKIENLLAFRDVYNISFNSEDAEDTEKAKQQPEMAKMLQNYQFKTIIDKIQKDLNFFPSSIYFNGNFTTVNPTAYVYISGDGSLTFLDALDKFPNGYKTEEDWGVQSWKRL